MDIPPSRGRRFGGRAFEIRRYACTCYNQWTADCSSEKQRAAKIGHRHAGSSESYAWEFPEIEGVHLSGVPLMRLAAFWGMSSGPPI